ncbi:hypothetical protein RchiOBHm_Chr2g0123971 [Rosa chinensis]|uniref:Uncharacterized protein n=1 Tax=Rosa chinensis TaxID=74649 RepID=A0A2P6RT91_ROSCH|nr:hypothetical protein RchiOBHm_Chr2g0123971 [Rosa chinensis]
MRLRCEKWAYRIIRFGCGFRPKPARTAPSPALPSRASKFMPTWIAPICIN